jgi:TonB family protein
MMLSLIFAAAFFPALSFGANRPEIPASEPAGLGELGGPHTAIDRSGVIATKEGLTLTLTTDLGPVRIITLEPGTPPIVRYTVHIETDARAQMAKNLLDRYSLAAKATPAGVEISGSLPPQGSRADADAQFWVQFEIAVPASFSLDINTDAGDIDTQDIGGTANLVTRGGNIRTGRIGFGGYRAASMHQPVAKLYTEGGHVVVRDVSGDVDAFTAGGHIVAGNISGNGTLRTGGGHIRAGKIEGRAQLETDGGNITLAQAGSFVSVRTGGGQIDFGEVRGSVRAQTGGGGIRIITVSGPMEVESNGGSICLTRVAGTVQAATAGGTITAWINPDAPSDGGTVHLAGASQLSSGAGDIIIFLPRNLAADIDAVVENGATGRIDSDPDLPLIIHAGGNHTAGPVHATAVLHGGGALLKLRTTVGKIRLKFLDSDVALRDSLIRQQQERINQRHDPEIEQVSSLRAAPRSEENPLAAGKSDWLESMLDRLEVYLNGGLREDASDFQKRLVYWPKPSYPELARRARIQGTVKLQVRVAKDGHIEVLKILQGEPVLADAAMDAVKRWRANPASINGSKVEVISTITFNFQLQ